MFLFAIGLGFENHAHVLMGSVDSPQHGTRVARVCFAAAIFYAVMLGFCSCQVRTIEIPLTTDWQKNCPHFDFFLTSKTQLRANRRVVRGGSVQL